MPLRTIASVLFILCSSITMPAWSADSATDSSSAGDNKAASCVEVIVNGERIPSYDCLTQKLMPKETGRPVPGSEMPSQNIVGKPSNQLGLFNYAATSNRMGNTFGSSVYPQRPPVTSVMPVTPAVPVLPR